MIKSNQSHCNVFKFSLYQEDVLICENIFDADLFNPFTRYSIDIREILPRAITLLQKTLSKKSYQTKISDDFDLYQYNQKQINLYPNSWKNGLRYSPIPIVRKIDDLTIKGVECKIGLYINDKPIVERLFYVDGFNPVSRWSTDIVNAVRFITEDIFEKIRNTDIINTWDDYDLINKLGLSITQIRDLDLRRREELLSNLK